MPYNWHVHFYVSVGTIMKVVLPPPLPLDNIAQFKWYRKQKPNSCQLLKEIIFRWRGSSARVRVTAGPWAAYPRSQWQEWCCLSRNQVDRALLDLEDMKLIQREVHRFAGKTTLAFLRPTELALRYMGRPGDLDRLREVSKQAIEKPNHNPDECLAASTDGPAGEKAGEKTSEKSDYTSLPSLSKKSTSQYKSTSSNAAEGKGKAGTKEGDDGQQEPEGLEKAKKSKGTPTSLWDDDEYDHTPFKVNIEHDDLFNNALHNLQAQKKAKLLKLFPVIPGVDEKKLQHPLYKYEGWEDWSKALQVKSYKKYELYAKNCKSKKKNSVWQ